MRLTDADELIKVFQHKLENNIFPLCVISTIEEAPTIEEELVKHGKWIEHDDGVFGLTDECSECHIETMGKSPYCPNCGARMDGDFE